MLCFATIAITSRLGLGHAVGEYFHLSRLAADTDIPHWEQQLLSVAIVGGVMVNGLRAMCAFRSLGPLVLMTIRMVEDVAQWLCVPIIVTIAFIFGFYSLHKGRAVLSSDDDCDIYKEELGGAPLTIGLKLFAPILGSDSMHECVMDPDAQWPAVNLASPFLMVVYLVTTAVLLLNMLIAMMAKVRADPSPTPLRSSSPARLLLSDI